ncbi:MAG: glycosyl hydrolase [Frankiales bacterium]|nr:glycosyl hydrolase [Frankiales bacterium]
MTRLAVGLVVLTGVAAPLAGHATAAASCPWMDPTKSADSRAHQLVKAMTLDQKIAELYGRGDIQYYGTANDIPAVPALCIPELVFNDAGAGVGDGVQLTTAFPDGITQAASWDPAMQRKLGAALGREARTKGIDVQLAPGVNIARTPLNGRNFEYAGEDPYLAAQTGVAEIQGIQSQHVAATVKHYALNDQETNRMTDSSDASERTMQEIHLPAFEAAVKAGVASVMCSYNRVNGVYACQQPYLLNTVLKGQFGFDGWVMSDWGGTHSTVAAAKAGLDQEQDVAKGKYFSDALKAAVVAHQVPMSRVDDMVLRLMRPLFRLGVIDNPPPTYPAAFAANASTARSLQIALEAAEGGAVLLKNSGVLPLTGAGKRIAVIGGPAGPAGAQNYYQGGGSSKVPLAGPNANVVSPLQGITTRAAQSGDVVTYADGSSTAVAAAVATAADVAVVVAGEAQSEGADRSSLAMSSSTCTLFGCVPGTGPSQDDLIAAVAKANPNTVVVLQTGDPVSMPWLPAVRGVLETWYPGQQDGTAAAALLFGDVNPSGKLPYTFPKKIGDTPIRSAKQWPGVAGHSTYSEGLLVGYRWYDAQHITPLFPFGFGLSYTSYRYSHLRVAGTTVSFDVTNTGKRAGAEVAQLYLSSPAAAHEPPKQLKGYRKVLLQPGQTQTVSLSLDARAFQYWSETAHSWQTATGCYTVRVGGSSASLPLTGRLGRGGAVCAAAVSAPRPVARPVPTGGLASTGLPVGLAAAALLLLLGAATAVRVRSAR